MSGDERGVRVLAVNGGSSSLKSALYDLSTGERLVYAATIDRIGGGRSRLRVQGGDGAALADEERALPDLGAALDAWLAWLRAREPALRLEGVGHRVVHGGPHGDRPRLIDRALFGVLRELVPLDPDHLPGQLQAIERATEAFPGVPQVACFDTTFHRTLPARARQYPLPREARERGVIRYGFHGLSYAYIVDALRREAGGAADGRVVIAHLGGGASMAAVHRGASVDTTMGLTPTGGLMMGTRCGDLDPGVVLRLLHDVGGDAGALNDLLNHRSGLLGVSGRTADMQELLAAAPRDRGAAEAVALFCYIARKWLGSLLAVLGGADTLVFTGGIGEHAPAVRAGICEGLDFAGIALDAARNAANAAVVSPDGAPVTVRVMPTNEALMIARQTAEAVGARHA